MKDSILRHLWYLTQPLVVLALFDDSIADEYKARMANALLAKRKPCTFRPAKPAFPVNTLRRNVHVTLDTLIGPKSWMIFDLLGFNSGWLAQNPNQWNGNHDYRAMKSVVKHLSVVNDAAERGIKDIQDYANAARDGAFRGNIILVSNSHRVKILEFRKNEMENNL